MSRSKRADAWFRKVKPKVPDHWPSITPWRPGCEVPLYGENTYPYRASTPVDPGVFSLPEYTLQALHFRVHEDWVRYGAAPRDITAKGLGWWCSVLPHIHTVAWQPGVLLQPWEQSIWDCTAQPRRQFLRKWVRWLVDGRLPGWGIPRDEVQLLVEAGWYADVQ